MTGWRELDATEARLLEDKLHSAAKLLGGDAAPRFADLQRKYDELLQEEEPSAGEVELLGYAFGAKHAAEAGSAGRWRQMVNSAMPLRWR